MTYKNTVKGFLEDIEEKVLVEKLEKQFFETFKKYVSKNL